MKDFLKKAAIAVVCLLLFVFVFWKSLISTAIWGLVIYQTWGLESVKIVPGQELVLTATTSTDNTQYGALLIPHFFDQTEVLQKNQVMTVFSDVDSNANYLLSEMAPMKNTFLAGHADKTSSEIKTLCSNHTSIFMINPCDNNYNFIATTMTASNKTAGFFSRRSAKTSASTFLLLKSVYLPPNTQEIIPFNSPTVYGYVAIAPRKSIAYLFDESGTGYEIAFMHMQKPAIETVLSQIQTTSTQE